MYRTMFVFAGREVVESHNTFCEAIRYARHVLTHWTTRTKVEIHQPGRFANSRIVTPESLLFTVNRKPS